jgi:hypothetical protein
MSRHRNPAPSADELALHPGRYRDRASSPVPAGPLGDPPGHLGPAQRTAWQELATQIPEGVLTIADRIFVEATCHLIAKMRSEHFEPTPAWFTALASGLGRMGLTPADRSKISVPSAPQPEDPFADLAAEQPARPQ